MDQKNYNATYRKLRIGLIFLVICAGISGLTMIIIHLRRPGTDPEPETKTVHVELNHDFPVPVRESSSHVRLKIKPPVVLETFSDSNSLLQIEENETLTTQFSQTYAIPSIEKIKMNRENPALENLNKVYYNVDEMPRFNGGSYDSFRNWIARNLRYPEIAAENGISGRVVIRFAVDPLGNVCDVKVIKSVDPTLDKEAIRVISSSPRWTPGKIKGKAVKVQFSFPVYFDLK